jgi:hypothetical protein
MAATATIASANQQPDEHVVRRARIPRWAGIVLPTAILGGVGLVVIQVVNQSWLPIVLLVAGPAALGLLTGLAARLSLPRRSNGLRWVVATEGLTVGLLTAGIVSGGEVGLGTLLPLARYFRWGEVLQLASAALAAWLAIRAYARPEQPLPAEPPLASGQANWGFTYHPTIYDTQPILARRGNPRLVAQPTRTGTAVARRSGTAPPRNPLHLGYRQLRGGLVRAFSWRRPAHSLRRPGRASSPIRFTGSGEDRCPYCLDVVAQNDRRGFTTCPVCHTRHHAECWAVTGTCQMPHLYEGRPAAHTGVAR